jgi:endonuclease YncB( thermonuclease family)
MTLQVLWSPAGESMPTLGSRALVDVTDGDTPTIRMPVRMLSVDTPEVTAGSAAGAERIDARFTELAGWIRDGRAPVSRAFADHVLPRLDTGRAGTLQFTQGQAASAFTKARIEERLTRPDGSRRSLFVRTVETPFDDNHRLLAYVAPNYSAAERAALPRADRATFNLDVVAAGWAASFVIYPAVPGELDLPLLVGAAAAAREGKDGIWADEATLPAYEYRALEKLHRVTRRIVDGADVPAADRFGWRVRYCADLRDRVLHGPEGYAGVPPEYRLWIWPRDLNAAIGRLNLVPDPALVNGA